jgi:hypothetical protein
MRVTSADTGNVILWGFDSAPADPDSGIEFERSTTGGVIRYVRWDVNGSDNGGTTGANMNTSTNYIWTERYGRTTDLYESFANGASNQTPFTMASGQISITYAYLGGYDTYSVAMVVSELAFFNRSLTDTERLYVERDIGARWGVAVA